MTEENKVHMPTLITEQAAFARVNAEDGAYFSAALILEKLAADIRAHAEWRKAELEKLVNGEG
jgi:hypothetical protein